MNKELEESIKLCEILIVQRDAAIDDYSRVLKKLRIAEDGLSKLTKEMPPELPKPNVSWYYTLRSTALYTLQQIRGEDE